MRINSYRLFSSCLLICLGIMTKVNATQFGIIPHIQSEHNDIYIDFEFSPLNYSREIWLQVGESNWLIPDEWKNHSRVYRENKTPIELIKSPYIKYRVCNLDRSNPFAVRWVKHNMLRPDPKYPDLEHEYNNEGEYTGISCRLLLGNQFIYIPAESGMQAAMASDENMRDAIYLTYVLSFTPWGRGAHGLTKGVGMLKGLVRSTRRFIAQTFLGSIVYVGTQGMVDELRDPENFNTSVSDLFSLSHNNSGSYFYVDQSMEGIPQINDVSFTNIEVFSGHAGFNQEGALILPKDQNIYDFAKKLRRMLGGDKRFRHVIQRPASQLQTHCMDLENCSEHTDVFFDPGASFTQLWFQGELSTGVSGMTLINMF